MFGLGKKAGGIDRMGLMSSQPKATVCVLEGDLKGSFVALNS